MSQRLGGIGIVVLFVAVTPTLGFGAARLLGAEVSGVTETRFTSRIADTAKALLAIYLALTLGRILALLLAAMNLYDAVVHSFATVATGGFSPKTACIAFYDSPWRRSSSCSWSFRGYRSRSTICSTPGAASTWY
jgi:trk system potassium uptake protein